MPYKSAKSRSDSDLTVAMTTCQHPVRMWPHLSSSNEASQLLSSRQSLPSTVFLRDKVLNSWGTIA